jgi:cell division transport system permease protein
MANSFKRISRAAWLDFSRNLGLSVATISIMTIVVLLATFLFFLNKTSNNLIIAIEDKVDVSVYIKSDVSEEDISILRDEISKMPSVRRVDYISRDDALQSFIEKHKNDDTLLEAIKEVGGNPFVASLSIKANDASKYGEITATLSQDKYSDIIEKVDYYERKPVVDKIFSWVSLANIVGIVFSLIFALIATLVAFNTVRLSIHNAREEIKTMRLVGASDWYIRGPFIMQGVIVGAFSILAAFIITLVFCWVLSLKLSSLMPETSVSDILWSNFWLLALIQIAAGIGLGVLSSMFAIRKNLKL